jgi:hypothetical protein
MSDEETIVGEIELPDNFLASAQQKKDIHSVMNSRLPFEVEMRWQLDRRPFTAFIIKVPQCPTVVPFAEWRQEVESCEPGKIFIGLDRRRKPFYSSFLTDNPHWGAEVQSRRGKSTMLSFTAAQILHQNPDAEVVGIDVKRESFKALFGVPRVTLSNDPRNIGHMWDTIKAFRDVMDARCDARAEDPSLDFPFRILMVDEVSQFSMQSKILWRGIKDKSDPAHPPVWEDIAAIFFQGAAFHCHVILTGQRLDDATTGGIGLIGLMGFRGLGGFQAQNYKRLIGGSPVPRSHPGRGRWLYSDLSDETWVQNVWATDEEIKDYAMTLAPTVRPLAAAESLPTPRSVSSPWVTGLPAAADLLGVNVETFRSRRKAAPVPGELRRGNQPMWREADLIAWAGSDALTPAGSVAS